MKTLFVTAGLAALGIASVRGSTYAPDVTAMDASKPWSVSGTLRGFYDDNYTTAHNSADGKRGSFGFEFSPSLTFMVPLQQTEIGLRYTYGLYYYQDREHLGDNPIDQTHQADLWIDHAFTERFQGKVQDSFVSAQDPQLGATPTSELRRVEGNNISNVGTATLHSEWSMLFSTDFGYQNTFYDYQNHGTTTADLASNGASLAGLLNQDNHLIWVNFNYVFRPDLTFLIGYQFGLNQYIGGEPIGFGPGLGEFYNSDNDNSYSHYVYGGTQYAITENLSASAQVGFQYTDNYNLPSFDHQSSSQVQPYAQIALTYTYLPGDYVQAGFTQSQNASDVANPSSSASDGLTLYEESSVLYASVNQQITPDLLASVIGHYQYSAYHGGAASGASQIFYNLGLNLTYTIDPHWSAEIGYNLDYLAASAGVSSYSRNREYLGVTATF